MTEDERKKFRERAIEESERIVPIIWLVLSDLIKAKNIQEQIYKRVSKDVYHGYFTIYLMNPENASNFSVMIIFCEDDSCTHLYLDVVMKERFSIADAKIFADVLCRETGLMVRIQLWDRGEEITYSDEWRP